MSFKNNSFIGLLQPQDSRPDEAKLDANSNKNYIRTQFSISTWLSLGATLQGLLVLLFGRLALLPAVALILYRLLDAYLITTGYKPNPLMNDVITQKFSAQFPDAQGQYGSKPADSEVVVLLLGARSNHPLGVFAPGFREMGEYKTAMDVSLRERSEEFGYLGATHWHSAGSEAGNTEAMSIYYFKTVAGLHAFAHSSYHRGGWTWWTKHFASHKHLSIYHETFHAPRGHWEAVYLNSKPLGISAVPVKITDEMGQTKWASPVVDASRGLLRTSAGRMSRSQADEHDGYGENPYVKV